MIVFLRALQNLLIRSTFRISYQVNLSQPYILHAYTNFSIIHLKIYIMRLLTRKYVQKVQFFFYQFNKNHARWARLQLWVCTVNVLSRALPNDVNLDRVLQLLKERRRFSAYLHIYIYISRYYHVISYVNGQYLRYCKWAKRTKQR